MTHGPITHAFTTTKKINNKQEHYLTGNISRSHSIPRAFTWVYDFFCSLLGYEEERRKLIFLHEEFFM
jgi:hypothetical protein